jgi:hypothetical protein
MGDTPTPGPEGGPRPRPPAGRADPRTPPELLFDANLKEFAAKVGNLVGLESNGKLPPADAYRQIKSLFKQLRSTKHSLEIDPPNGGAGGGGEGV